MYIIETPRLGLREWKDRDMPLFVEMNMDEHVMEFFLSTMSNEETITMVERIKKFLYEK